MSDEWRKDGALPAPFEHFMNHLLTAGAQLGDALNGSLPATQGDDSDLDKAVALAVDPAADAIRRTVAHLAEMPGLDEERLAQLTAVLDRHEQDATDQAGRFGNGTSSPR